MHNNYSQHIYISLQKTLIIGSRLELIHLDHFWRGWRRQKPLHVFNLTVTLNTCKCNLQIHNQPELICRFARASQRTI